MGSKRLFLPPEEKLPSLGVRKLSGGEGPTLQRKAGRGTEPAAVPGALRKPWKSVCPEEKEVAELPGFPVPRFPCLSNDGSSAFHSGMLPFAKFPKNVLKTHFVNIR